MLKIVFFGGLIEWLFDKVEFLFKITSKNITSQPNKDKLLMKKIIVAIDGFASCGKSTIAKGLAKHLNYIFIDTGAMYRAATLFFLDNDINIENPEAVKNAVSQLHIHFENCNGQNCAFLNGKNVENEIRSMRVANYVSPVAAISAVRRAMVKQQQEMGKSKGVVLDGRDIGTVVFPNAELKLFITAEIKVRTQRRVSELQSKGQEVDFESVQHNLLERDRMDSNRADSPLRQADDAIVVDTTHLTFEEQLKMVYELAATKISLELV